MNPYLSAFDAYHADGPPFIPWATMLDFHFQHGVILNTPTLFLVARPIPASVPLEEHPTLTAYPHGSTWHLWIAGGNLREMVDLPIVRRLPPDTLITFQRGTRSARIHAVPLRHLFSRA